MSDDPTERLSALYTRAADEEFRGRSPLYEAISRGVAQSQAALAFLATLPPDKWQPNLLLVGEVEKEWPHARKVG